MLTTEYENFFFFLICYLYRTNEIIHSTWKRQRWKIIKNVSKLWREKRAEKKNYGKCESRFHSFNVRCELLIQLIYKVDTNEFKLGRSHTSFHSNRRSLNIQLNRIITEVVSLAYPSSQSCWIWINWIDGMRGGTKQNKATCDTRQKPIHEISFLLATSRESWERRRKRKRSCVHCIVPTYGTCLFIILVFWFLILCLLQFHSSEWDCSRTCELFLI